MELWQKIVKIHDIVGTKPIDIACCISQMRDNKLGRLRKFHDDTLISSRKFKQLKVRYYIQQRVQHHKGHFQWGGGGGGPRVSYISVYSTFSRRFRLPTNCNCIFNKRHDSLK